MNISTRHGLIQNHKNNTRNREIIKMSKKNKKTLCATID